MESLIAFLRHRIFASSHDTQYFEEEIARLVHTIRDTVINGISNSLLVIGRRGSGKSHLLRESIEKSKKDPEVRNNLIEININGLLHTDDRLALHAIAKQLHLVCSTISVEQLLQRETEGLENCEDNDDENINHSDGIRLRNFSDQLRWLLSGLKAGDGVSNKALVVVIEEFDLFAAHRNQALLYNLLDVSCHAEGAPICVIGVTCRLDVMEMLEKRVKSRFSHRQLHVLPIASPLLTDPSMNPDNDDDDEDINGGGLTLRPFERYRVLAANLLKITDKRALTDFLNAHPQFGSTSSQKKVNVALQEWNSHVNEFFEDDLVSDCLRQTWEVSTCVRKLRSLIALLIARLDGQSKPRLDPQDFIDVLSKLRQDAKTALLPSLALLELLLITTMVKLHEIREGQPLNFETVFHEYTRFCRTNCQGYLYEKAVVAKALDNLKELELVVCGREALATAASGGVGVNAAGGARGRGGKRKGGISAAAATLMTATLPAQLRNFQPIACFVTSPLISACLDAYPGCPVELTQWAHSRTL